LMWRTFSPRQLSSNNPGRVTSCRDLGLRRVGFQPAPRALQFCTLQTSTRNRPPSKTKTSKTYKQAAQQNFICIV